MRVRGRRAANPISVPATGKGADLGRLLPRVLIGSGLLLLLTSLAFAGHSLLKNWLVDQDYYLTAGEAAPLPVATMSWMALARSGATPWLTPTPRTTATPLHVPMGTPAPVLGESPVLARTAPAAALPLSTATPVPTPKTESLTPPIRIEIPFLDINRSIIPLARQTDRSAGVMTWNSKKLFRSRNKDPVGRSKGSASPGEEGNMILVGHTYGNGHKGAFAGLKQLTQGRQVHVSNSAGESFTYKVKTIKNLRLGREDAGALALHLSFLSTGGPERLTLVSCSGAGVEPCQERIYVVAEPAE